MYLKFHHTHHHSQERSALSAQCKCSKFKYHLQVVHYDLVHQPIHVVCEEVDTSWLWHQAPSLAQFVEDLPVGKPPQHNCIS